MAALGLPVREDRGAPRPVPRLPVEPFDPDT